jgi:predicted dehydrogenase
MLTCVAYNLVMSKSKVRWGILGVANIAVKKVVPGMQTAPSVEIAAIASRDLSKARAAASKLSIATAYGSYEELLADPAIDAIYNPLPNHLHVPWSVKAADAGKHVLCEKPIALDAAEAQILIDARDRNQVKIGEAFMVRVHPQWLRAREIVRSGALGELRAITGVFSYFNNDPANVRNQADIGGGGMLDIGCYPITMSRFLFGREPVRVAALVDRDPEMRVDRLATAILDFAPGQSSFTVSTQMVPYQRTQILGTKGRVEIEIPYNAPPDKPTRIFVDSAVEEFATVDQYMLQGEAFSRAILDGTEVPVSLEDARMNMRVIDAVLKAGETKGWETV